MKMAVLRWWLTLFSLSPTSISLRQLPHISSCQLGLSFAALPLLLSPHYHPCMTELNITVVLFTSHPYPRPTETQVLTLHYHYPAILAILNAQNEQPYTSHHIFKAIILSISCIPHPEIVK